MSYLSNFNYQLYGESERPKLVFLHGLMGSAANWRPIINSFKDSFHILAYDQRAHGRSFQPESGFAPKDYALDLYKILNELGWSRISLVGHSMGGRNALSFASSYPEFINKLVIEDIGPERRPESFVKMKSLLNLAPTPFSSREEARDFFLDKFIRFLPDHPNAKALGQYFYSNMKELKPGEVSWRFSKPAILETVRLGREEEAWEAVKSLKAPSLIIRGGLSDELSDEVLQKMKSLNENIQTATIPEAGHWVHSDRPQLFIEALKGFL